VAWSGVKRRLCSAVERSRAQQSAVLSMECSTILCVQPNTVGWRGLLSGEEWRGVARSGGEGPLDTIDASWSLCPAAALPVHHATSQRKRMQ
jgi:hypothetical protein